jgi:hypothetical protein
LPSPGGWSSELWLHEVKVSPPHPSHLPVAIATDVHQGGAQPVALGAQAIRAELWWAASFRGTRGDPGLQASGAIDLCARPLPHIVTPYLPDSDSHLPHAGPHAGLGPTQESRVASPYPVPSVAPSAKCFWQHKTLFSGCGAKVETTTSNLHSTWHPLSTQQMLLE